MAIGQTIHGVRDVARSITRQVDCPECHLFCSWCACYASNAREAGCGLSAPTGAGLRSKRRCDWGERLKGTSCGTCDGSGRVYATTTYHQRLCRPEEP